MPDPELQDPNYAQWVIAVAISALLALPASQQAAQGDSPGLLQNSMALLERYRQDRKGGGKNAKHANPQRKTIATDRLRQARDQHLQLRRKPNKNKRDKQALRQARRQLKHLKRKADYGGDHDSQNPKGKPHRRS